jgi:serine/threonine protein kinase
MNSDGMPRGNLTGQKLGSYLLLDQIAEGGMAEIYLAKAQGVAGFERLLCVKIILPSFAKDQRFIEMLVEEAKIAVTLNHPNIAQIFDLGQDQGITFIAMEFLDGIDLFDLMATLSGRRRAVPIEVATFIAKQICHGLAYAHQKADPTGRPLGLVHRDISPQNILLSRAGEVKIVDFGIAKVDRPNRRATQAGVIKGKYFYMSPEQASGDPIDGRTDIFSTGIILYEVLTGSQLYIEEDDTLRLLKLVRNAKIPPPSLLRSDLPPDLEAILLKALAKNPEERWQTAHELEVALQVFLYAYAPDFTPVRVSEIVEEALRIREPRSVVGASTEDDLTGGRTEGARVTPTAGGSYAPEPSPSALLRLDGLLPLRADEEPDETLVSGPPTDVLRFQPDLGSYDPDSEPTWIGPGSPDGQDRGPLSSIASVPSEIVVPLLAPSAQASPSDDAGPEQRPGDDGPPDRPRS